MAHRKNADGVSEYYHKPYKTVCKIIQRDWFREHGYKPDQFPPEFFENVEKELSLGERGYWALAMDGDGCVDRHKNAIAARIALTDREPIQRLADIYGVSVSCTEFPTEDWKDSYKIQIYGKRALHFLYLICPYMTEKRKKVTQIINTSDPNYHPPKIPMNFRQNPGLLNPHMGMVAGLFDTEGTVGTSIQETKYKTKKFGNRISYALNSWIQFSNTNIRLIRKVKKILETWPFVFKPTLFTHIRKGKKKGKAEYTLRIPTSQHLLFMALFSPIMLITRKKDYFEKFKRKKQIYEICDKK